MNQFTGKKNKHFSLEVSFNNGFVQFLFLFASYELEYNSVKIINFTVFIIIVFFRLLKQPGRTDRSCQTHNYNKRDLSLGN